METLTANITVKNLLSQLYEWGKIHMTFDEVIDQLVGPKDLPTEDIYYETKNGFKRLNMTTCAW